MTAQAAGRPDRTHRVEHIWGTAVGVDVRGPGHADVVDDLFAWFQRVDDLFSTWRDDTEISRLARGELEREQVSPEVHTVLALCDRVSAESHGAFDIAFGADPRVAPREGLGPIDPSGLVKGWVLDVAAERLRAAGAARFTLNAGGDVIAHGGPAPGQPWRVGVQHPWVRDQVAAVLVGADLAVATSGAYERGGHIIDPRTGRSATGLASVTVVGADIPLALADGYATAAVVLGAGGMDWLAALPSVEAMAITDAKTVVVTDGFDRYRLS